MLKLRSQDLPPAFALNGAIYVGPSTLARQGLSFVQPGMCPFVMEDLGEALDIDTPEDWRMAESLVSVFGDF